jgi:hypothetical protein
VILLFWQLTLFELFRHRLTTQGSPGKIVQYGAISTVRPAFRPKDHAKNAAASFGIADDITGFADACIGVQSARPPA